MWAVQPRHLMRHPPRAEVPESQRAIKVAGCHKGAIGGDGQGVADGGAHHGAAVQAVGQAPHLQKGGRGSGVAALIARGKHTTWRCRPSVEPTPAEEQGGSTQRLSCEMVAW